MITNTCQACTAKFTKPNNPNRVYLYCSKPCYGQASKKERAKKPCGNCGHDFMIWAYEVRAGRQYCSVSCANVGKDQGKTTEAFRLRTSKKYAEWRKAVFKRDNYTCQECGIVGGTLNADHIKRFADYPELRLNVDNGRTLCVPCHLLTPTFGNRKLSVAQEN